MKKTAILIFLAMVVSTAGLGCLDSPPSPASDIPKITVDRLEEENVTEIYIHGLEEVMYPNITLNLNGETVVERNKTYAVVYRTNLTEFNIYSEIHHDNIYYFNSTFLVSDEKGVVYEVTDENGDTEKISNDDLPYKERFQEMEENR